MKTIYCLSKTAVKMEPFIKISNLNDFIFCPASIYYHGIYEELDRSVYQEIDQIRGTFVHGSIDRDSYSTKKDILQGIEVYSNRYRIIGKIDIFDIGKKTLVERKYKINTIYDGYVFQLYAQYFGMIEQGFDIRNLKLYSYSDNRSHPVQLPSENHEMFERFEELLKSMASFDLTRFRQKNIEKCQNCIYAPLCVNGGELLC